MKNTLHNEKVHCAHCGEECVQNEISSDDKSFCCEGCKTVYSILNDNGLCDYYRYDNEAIQSLKNIPAYRKERFSYLDDPEVQERLLDFSSQSMNRVRFHLPQIHCTSCLWLLEKLNRIDGGIIRSVVDFTRKELSVEYSPADTSIRRIVELLTSLGYEPNITVEGNKKTINHAKRALYLKLGLAGFATGNIMLFSMPEYFDTTALISPQYSLIFRILNITLATPVLLYSASDYWKNAYRAIKNKSMSLDVPLALGIIALYVRSLADIITNQSPGFMDSFSGLVFLLLIGKLVQQRTFDALSFERNYTSYLPLSIQMIINGIEHSQSVTTLKPGDIIHVRNKEIVPTDSILISPHGHVDYSFVTGETAPVEIVNNAKVYAGGRIVGNSVELMVQKDVSRSYLTQLWNNEIFKKEKYRAFHDISARFGLWFTVAVIIIATGAGIYWLPNTQVAASVFTAVLIIACPCALSLAAPFALNTAMRMMSRASLFLKNTDVVLDMAETDSIVFDKTGTLTTSLNAEVQFNGKSLNDVEKMFISGLAKRSSHPLAQAIYKTIQSDIEVTPDEFNEYVGKGIYARYSDEEILFGTVDFVTKSDKIQTSLQQETEQSTVHISINGNYRGFFAIHNAFRSGIDKTLQHLHSKYSVHVISGDSPKDAEYLQTYLPSASMKFRQTPDEKMNYVQNLSEKHSVMMIGDGLNDAAALQASAVGIAVTENTAAFTPACDAILSANNIDKIPTFIEYAQFTKKTIVTAFIISVFYNILGLWLAVTAQLTPVITAILMPVSSLSIVAFVVWTLTLKAKRKGLV